MNTNRGAMIRSSSELADDYYHHHHHQASDMHGQVNLPETHTYNLDDYEHSKIRDNMEGHDEMSSYSEILSIQYPSNEAHSPRASEINQLVSSTNEESLKESQSFVAFVCHKLSCYDSSSKHDLTSQDKGNEYIGDVSNKMMSSSHESLGRHSEQIIMEEEIFDQVSPLHSRTHEEWHDESLSFSPSLHTQNFASDLDSELAALMKDKISYEDKCLMDCTTTNSTNSYVSEIELLDYDEVQLSNLSHNSASVQLEVKEPFHEQKVHKALRNYDMSDMNQYPSNWTSSHEVYKDHDINEEFDLPIQLNDDKKYEMHENESQTFSMVEENDVPALRNNENNGGLNLHEHLNQIVERSSYSINCGDVARKQRKTFFREAFIPPPQQMNKSLSNATHHSGSLSNVRLNESKEITSTNNSKRNAIAIEDEHVRKKDQVLSRIGNGDNVDESTSQSILRQVLFLFKTIVCIIIILHYQFFNRYSIIHLST